MNSSRRIVLALAVILNVAALAYNIRMLQIYVRIGSISLVMPIILTLPPTLALTALLWPPPSAYWRPPSVAIVAKKPSDASPSLSGAGTQGRAE
jgi:hypothetical protein